MTEPMILRQSDLAMYLNCRRKFYLMWQRRHAPKASDTDTRPCTNADVGTMVHAILALYYKGELEDQSYVNMHNVALGTAEAIEGSDLNEKSWIDGATLAATMVRDYPRWIEHDGGDLRYNVVGVEEKLEWEFKIRKRLIKVTGTLDLRLYDELLDCYSVGDHKSKVKMAPPRPGNFQLLTYALLTSLNHPDAPVSTAFWNVIKRNLRTAKANPPHFVRHPITINQPMLDLHHRRLIRLLTDITKFVDMMEESSEHALDAPANMTGECDWACPVREICDLMDNPLYDWQGLANEEYPMRETPVELEGEDD